MQADGILETSLYADDLVAAERFYAGVLGLRVVTKLRNRHVFFSCGNAMLLIFNPRESSRPPVMGSPMPVPPHGATGPGHVCFRAYAHEIPQWISRLRAANVRIEADFTWPTGGRSIYFRDPAGNSLEFAEPRLWPLG
jgi:catechol 2,3-dioxygenase-like lactoylglutathione lyase family enzyme